MRTLRIAPLLAAVLALVASSSPAQETPRDGVFIHLSHGADDGHRALMALTMASHMSADKDVLVYLDIEAVHLALGGATVVKHASFQPSDVLLEQLLGAGVTVMACPTCLAAAGKGPADLRPGVQIADKQAFFAFTKGRILSLDY